MEQVYIKDEKLAKKIQASQTCVTRLYYHKHLGWRLYLSPRCTLFKVHYPNWDFMDDGSLDIFNDYTEILDKIKSLRDIGGVSKGEHKKLNSIFNQLLKLRNSMEKR